jgi:hypothetical protein
MATPCLTSMHVCGNGASGVCPGGVWVRVQGLIRVCFGASVFPFLLVPAPYSWIPFHFAWRHAHPTCHAHIPVTSLMSHPSPILMPLPTPCHINPPFHAHPLSHPSVSNDNSHLHDNPYSCNAHPLFCSPHPSGIPSSTLISLSVYPPAKPNAQARTGRGIQGARRRPQAARPAGGPPPKRP